MINVFPVRNCIICNTQFIPKIKTNTICPSADCKKKHEKEYRKKYNATLNKETRKENCIICGKEFVSFIPNKKICGEPDCKKERSKQLRIAYRKKYYKEENDKLTKECTICGTIFKSKCHNRKICYNPECEIKRRKELQANRKRRELLKAKGMLNVCKVCEKEFEWTGEFCSKSCMDRWSTAVKGFEILRMFVDIV